MSLLSAAGCEDEAVVPEVLLASSGVGITLDDGVERGVVMGECSAASGVAEVIVAGVGVGLVS